MIAMESKHSIQQHTNTHSLRPRKRPVADFNSSINDGIPADSGSSSRSTSTRSPTSPGDTRFLSLNGNSTTTSKDMTPDDDDSDGDGDGDSASPLEPSIGAHRSKNSSSSGLSHSAAAKLAAKDKRKRSRVTPEQLTHLERFFVGDKSPTAAKRREISELLGMHERQTQIWFQNRRAKAKLLDGKKRGVVGEWIEASPDTPPQLCHGFEDELQQLIHETDPITIIPCSDLSIGTWRRISATSGKHDLVAYVCENRRCLTWFIHSAGYGFKMEIPFGSIVQTDFSTASAPGQSLVSITLERAPIFYLETNSTGAGGGGSRIGIGSGEQQQQMSTTKGWQTCTDWTEGMQATKVLRHDLVGSAIHLTHFLEELRRYRSVHNVNININNISNNTTATQPIPLISAPMSMHNGNGINPASGNSSRSTMSMSMALTPMQIPEPSQMLGGINYVDDRSNYYSSHNPGQGHGNGRKRSPSNPPIAYEVYDDVDIDVDVDLSSSDIDLRNSMSTSAPYFSTTSSSYPDNRRSSATSYLSASQGNGHAMSEYHDPSEQRHSQALSMQQHQQSCLSNYTNSIPISHSAQSRHASFTNTHSSSPQPYVSAYDTRRPSLFKIDQLQRDSVPPPTGTTASSHSHSDYDYVTPSPPLLTMPFQSHSHSHPHSNSHPAHAHAHPGNGISISAQSRLRHSQSSEDIPFSASILDQSQSISRMSMSSSPQDYSSSSHSSANITGKPSLLTNGHGFAHDIDHTA